MLLNFGPTFRSLTASSPIKTVVDQAHRQARRWLENGGAVSAKSRAADHTGAFVIPSDVDPVALTAAIDEKLRGGRGSRSGRDAAATTVLEHGTDGSRVVAALYVQRLGDGDYNRGKRFLGRVVADMRARRVLSRSRPT
jgi:hypothetical protein